MLLMISSMIHFHRDTQIHLSTKLNHTVVIQMTHPGLIFIINRFDIVRIHSFGEVNLRLQRRVLAPRIVSLPVLRHELITHGNILRIMVTVLLERWHPPNAIVISLQVLSFEIMVPQAMVIVMCHFGKRGMP